MIFSLFKWKSADEDLNSIDKDSNLLLRNLYPAAYSIFKLSKYKLHISAKNSKIENLKKLYIGTDSSTIEKLYFCRLFSIIILVVWFTLIIIIIFAAFSGENLVLHNDYYIERESPEGQDKKVELDVSIGDDKQNIVIDITAKRYSDKEFKTKLKEAKNYVKDNYLGDNKSSEEVCESLNLVTYIPDNAIKVQWECDVDDIVAEDGSIERSQITEPVVVQITAIFSYFEIEEDMPLEFIVVPVKKSKRELLWDKWSSMLHELSQITAQSDFLQLPLIVEGKKVSYKSPEKNCLIIIITVSIFVIILVPVLIDSRMKEKIKQREQELRIDYPEFVEKFVLLISAGLNCKGAWYRIADEYTRKCKNGNKKRYLYEEILLTKRQLENGMNEAKAYELFGRRTGILKYMKFSTMLVQNLKKGSSELLKILEYEAADVLKERRENAKILGEQAGTKLLMPMMLMMIEVFAIIIYAAFQNM